MARVKLGKLLVTGMMKLRQTYEACLRCFIEMSFFFMFKYHDYDKRKKTCKVCGRNFTRKPTSDNCPGVPIRELRADEILPGGLSAVNRRLKSGSIPVAYKDFTDNSRSKKRDESVFIYKFSDTEIIDKSLPPAFYSEPDIPEKLNPISEHRMRSQKLEPKPGAKPIAITREWAKDGDFYQYWLYYYSKDDCQPGNSLGYITKGRLKSEYHLSEGWIKKLGEPDLIQDNPYYKRAAGMKLYNLGRVRQFLKDNADDYAAWLALRERYVINAKPLIEAAKARKQLKEQLSAAPSSMKKGNQKQLRQNVMCLECSASTFLEDGIFCAIHPMSLPDGVPEQNFCPDFQC